MKRNPNPFDEMYQGSPPWEIGQAQPFVTNLLDAGKIVGDVLDVGCGTGENSLVLAQAGHKVVGVDFARTAIAAAQAKAESRGVSIDFRLMDVLHLESLGRPYDTLIDSGVFHVFADETRPTYVRSLAAAARVGTVLHLVCFSEHEPSWGGPRRVTRDEIHATFTRPWLVEKIEPARYATRLSGEGAAAWLATIVYLGRNVSQGN